MIPDRKQNVSLDLYNPKSTTKAIDIRRQIMEMPDVFKSLSNVDKYVFSASTKKQISEYDDEMLVDKTKQMFRFIAMDVGYNIPSNTDDWAYIQTRLLDIIKRYYSQLTLADIKLAFELSITGELDNYLPKDSQGNPDKKHYQQFNADYFAKILNAYVKKQRDVIHDVYKDIPKKGNEISEEKKQYYHEKIMHRIRYIFLHYKYSGILHFHGTDEMFIYDWLFKQGLSERVNVNQDDRRQAFVRYMQRVANGMINKYTAYHVRKQGINSPEIDYSAYEVARRKEIVRAFDYMIKNEIQIDNLLRSNDL